MAPRAPGRIERIATVVLAVALVAVLAWRYGDVGARLGLTEGPGTAARGGGAGSGETAEPAARAIRGIPADGFSIVVMWVEGRKPELRHFVLPVEQVRARIGDGKLAEMLEQLPDTPLKERRYGVFRTADGAGVAPADQETALAGGNRCLMVLTEQVIGKLGGPASAPAAVRGQLPETLRCEELEEGANARP